MAATTLDPTVIASFSGWTQPRVHTLIEAPSTDLVTSFLEAIVSRAQEHERLKADRLRVDVELENAVRGGEAKARVLKATNEKKQQEVESLRAQLNDQEVANARLTDQLHSLESSSTSSTAETQSLHAQISKLESSNRETLSLLDAKSTAYDKLAEELTAQHKKTVDLRREISIFEEKLQNADNTVNSAKFKESALQSEVELLKRNNDWLDSELKTKSEEFSKFRKEKNARIAELQRLNEDAAQQIDDAQQTEQRLRKTLEEARQKADEYAARIQQVQEDAARSEESFRLELDSTKRLADLQKQSGDTARRRVQELEESLEQMKDDAADEISQGLAEVENERQVRQAAEEKLEQLEEEVEKLRRAQAGIETQAPPGTPQRLPNGFAASVAGSARGGSPAPFSPSASRRGGLSFTQLYAEFNATKTELDAEKRRSEKLATTLDDLIRDMEQREPEAQESQLELERLQSENNDLSSMLALTRQEKDSARKDARRYQSQGEALKREADLLKQQLRDLSAQIKVLLVEVQVRENGIELSAAERVQLQQAASGENDVEALEGMSDTARFISQRLISFKNIFELQDKNAELTRIVREIGEQQEAAEATSQRLRQTEQERDAFAERVERFKDEMKSMVAQSQSYIRERDMFRRMLSHRGQIPRDADLESMFGASVNEPATPRTPHVNRVQNGDQSPNGREIADLSKLLKEYQSQFDAYRRETGTDMTSLKDQNASLSKDKSHLQGEIARINSQLTLAHERYSMLQANLEQLHAENTQLQTRAQSVMESAAKQDMKTQQVAEELIEAKSMTESMRNENANLKAEKDLAKRIEARLQEDNKFLQDERSRLSTALTEAQRLFNEREMSDAEIRRKLQAQIDSLETELRSIKQKLDEEIESGKAATLRKEYESEQSRSRIEDLVKMVSNVKEELAAAKTARDQLQTRVDELKIELRSAEERAQALQPRPTARPTVTSADVSTTESGTLAREQELSLEIADLHRDLDLARNELENAHAQVEQYKAIAQSSEEELQALNDTNDQYREEMDKLLSGKQTKIDELEQRLQDMSSELEATNNQLNDLRTSSQGFQGRLDQQRVAFETELAQVKDESEKYKEAAAFHQEDLKAQAEIAQQAQQSYENELVKHGEATKQLHTVRTELNQLRLEVSQYKADAEAARATMSQSEDSWLASKETYEKELTELKSRKDDVVAQNKVLHEQLENFSKQIAAMQEKRSDTAGQAISTVSSDAGVQNLQEVIKYLRNEKEIVDVQLELATQETRRLRQTLEYTQSQLDDTRLKLEQERQKQADKDRSAINHSKLMDTINELNVFRESNVTLRNQLQQIEAQLAEKSKQAEELIAQIQPLQSSVRELESEKETTQGELKLLEEDRNRWQQRTQNILQKYDRIDPAELEALKEQISQLQTERDEAVSKEQTLQEQVKSFPDELEKGKQEARTTMRATLAEQFKARSRELSGKIKESDAAAKAAKDQYEQVASELEAAKAERDTARSELDAAIAARDEAQARAEAAQAEPKQNNDAIEISNNEGLEEGQVDASMDDAAAKVDNTELEHKLQDAEARAQTETERVQAVQAELDGQRTRVEELEARIKDLEQQLDAANSRITNLLEQAQQPAEGDQNEHLERVQQDLAAAQQEIEALRQASIAAPVASAVSTEHPADVKTQVEAEVLKIRAQLDSEHAQRVKQETERFNTRATNMKEQLQNKLKEARAKADESNTALKAEHATAIQKLQEDHDASLSQIRLDHEKQVSELRQQHQQELETLKTSTSESASAPTTTSSIIAPATENAFNSDSTVNVKSEALSLSDIANWTLSQAQQFIKDNEPIKQIVVKNVRTRLEAETAKLKQDSESELNQKLEAAKRDADANLAQKLEEARTAADKAREQAVSMEAKKSSLKNNLLEGRVRGANAKLEYIGKVASETPDRPVGEVWTEAKDVKPAPPQSTSQPTVQTSSANGQPTGVAQSPRPQTPTHVRRQSTLPSANTQSSTTSQPSTAATPAPADTSIAQTSTPATERSTTETATSAQSGSRPSTGTGPAGLRGALSQGSGIPRGGGLGNRGAGAPRGGRGGIPTSGSAQSASSDINASVQPTDGVQAQTQAARGGSSLPRGHFGAARGGRGGRGGANAGGVPQAGEGSPGSGRGGGNLNARAGTFVPNKRPAGDNAGGDGKRMRGGGGAASGGAGA